MTDREFDVDVCIVGGGPAGTALARRLQQLGYSTALLERALAPGRNIGTSLASSTMPLLEVLGIRERVERAGFLASAGAFVKWGSETEHRQTEQGALHVDRRRFDALMLRGASEAGTCVLTGAHVVEARREDDYWRVRARAAEGEYTIRAQMLGDASGRSGPIRATRIRARTRTVALYAYWRTGGVQSSDARVEAAADAWYWAAPLPEGELAAAVFVDAAGYRDRLAAAGGRTALYNRLLAESLLLSPCDGTRITDVFVCDASAVRRQHPATRHSVSVGDAALAIDPLSSQGVEVAIGTALHAAAVINTMFRNPNRSELALDFFACRIKESSGLHELAAASFYRMAAERWATSFWLDRSMVDSHARSNDVSNSAPDEDLETVRIGPGVRMVPSGALVNDEIVAADAVSGPALATSAVFVAGVEVAPLLQMIRPLMSANELYEVWSGIVSPEKAGAVLRWAIENRVVVSGCSVLSRPR